MILDTSFVIDVLRGSRSVESWEATLDEGGVASVTPITVMELWEGIQRTSATESEREAVERLLGDLSAVPFDRGSAMRAGRISATLSTQGQQIEIEDVMIGAIALEHDEPVLTGNADHFERIDGLDIETY